MTMNTNNNRIWLMIIISMISITNVIGATVWQDTMEVTTAFDYNWTRGNYTCTYGGSNYAGNSSSCALLVNASINGSIPSGGIQPGNYQSYELYNGSMHVSIRNSTPISSGGLYWWGFTSSGQNCVSTGRGVCMSVDPSTATYKYNVGGASVATGVVPNWNNWDYIRFQIINSSIQVWINGVNTNNDTLANANSANSNRSIIANQSGTAQYFPIFDNWQVCQGSCDNPTQSANQVLTLNLVNGVNGSSITGFCVNITSTNTSQYLCNSTGTSITTTTTFVSGNISFVNITGSHAAPTYFNATLLNQNFTSTKSISTNTSQIRILLQAYRLFLNTSINTFNSTNNLYQNTTSSGTVLLFANNGSNNIKTDVAGNYSKNSTCTSTNTISTINCNVTGVYDSVLSLQAYNGATSVSSFTINVTSTSIGGGYLYSQSTTNGTLLLPMTQGYTYQVTFSSNGYVTTSANITVDSAVEAYNFSTSLTRTLYVTFLDEETEYIINYTTIFLEMIGNNQSANLTTTNGTIFVTILTAGNYTLRYGANGYATRLYKVSIDDSVSQNLNLTLLNSSSATTVTVYVYDEIGSPVEGAVVKVLRYNIVDNAFEINQIVTTNFEGRNEISVEANNEYYKFIIEYNNNVVYTSTPTYIFGTTLSFHISILESGFTNLFNQQGISGNITYNNVTKIATFTFNDIDNIASQGCLYAYEIRQTAQVLNDSSCTASSSGTVFLTINSTNRYFILKGIVTKDLQSYTIATYYLNQEDIIPSSGKLVGLFVLFMLLSLSAFIATYSLEAGIFTSGLFVLLTTLIGISPVGINIAIPVFIFCIIIAVMVGYKQ